MMDVHRLVDSLYIKELAKKTHRGLEGRALQGLHTSGICLANLGAAIAKTGGSATLISTLQQKEEELSQLRKSAAALRDDKISIWSEARLRKRIKSEISNLPALLNEDSLRARTEILRHVG